MNVVELKTSLQSLLATELGTYTGNIPSIWVYGSAQAPPSTSTGLECLIRQLSLQPAQGSSAGYKYKPQQWEVILTNFKQDSKLIKAIEKIESRFKVIQYTHQPFTNTEYERARLLIFDPIFVPNI